MLWEVWHVEPLAPGGERRVAVLGRVRAPHWPAALARGRAKWRKVPPERITARSVKWLNEMRRKVRQKGKAT